MKTFENVDDVLHVSVGQQFEIVLAVNATTGFVWNVVDKSDGCRVSDSTFETASKSGIGGGGTQHIAITVDRPGTHHLNLSLFQPWDPAEAQEQRTIHVVASAGGA